MYSIARSGYSRDDGASRSNCSYSFRADVVDRSGSVAGEGRDFLRHTILKDVEIRGMKAADVVAFLIGHDDRDQHLLNVEPDDGFLLGEQVPGRDEEDQAGKHLVHCGSSRGERVPVASSHDRLHASIVSLLVSTGPFLDRARPRENRISFTMKERARSLGHDRNSTSR
ncbi:hypothetical protein SBA4_3260016 [Candidatus Sulfopaludibacter sp. SbA4]|nr:hypothetical protein SBA4_3260016 [Candidatus Sulfopaludibacter sp. SbA4]